MFSVAGTSAVVSVGSSRSISSEGKEDSSRLYKSADMNSWSDMMVTLV